MSLSSEDGLVEGVSYIVEVGAVNRYGESAVSGNSEPFEIGDGSTKHSNIHYLPHHVCSLSLCLIIQLMIIFIFGDGTIMHNTIIIYLPHYACSLCLILILFNSACMLYVIASGKVYVVM